MNNQNPPLTKSKYLNLARQNVLKVLALIVLAVGAVIGIVLVKENQNISEKALEETPCKICTTQNICQTVASPPECTHSTNLCSTNADCANRCPNTDCSLPTGAKNAIRCVSPSTGNEDICCPPDKPNYVQFGYNGCLATCPNTDCSIPASVPGNLYCMNPSDGRPTQCCPVGSPIYDPNTRTCKTSGGSGGGGGGGTPTNPPTNPPGGGGGGSGGGTSCGGYTSNPGTFSGISKSGKLVVHVDPVQYQFNIILKKNADTCSRNDNDQILDTKDAVNYRLDTTIDVNQGDRVCVKVEGYDGTPGGGWIGPQGNLCQGQTGTPRNISNLLNLVPEAVSVQCWGDLEVNECDFNDWAIVFSVDEGITPQAGLSFLLRFQGITKKAASQLLSFSLLAGQTKISEGQNVSLENSDDGVYILKLGENIAQGTYNLLAKGQSHLQKRFTNVVYNGGDQTIDLSSVENLQMRAGDVNGDNALTIEDVSQVLTFYTDFSVPVDQNNARMVQSDIDKNGRITIQDVALMAINWSDFRVEGDN